MAQIDESERDDYMNNLTKCASTDGEWEAVDFTFKSYRVFCNSWDEDNPNDNEWDQSGCEASNFRKMYL